MSEWVSVTDRMPEIGRFVLVFLTNIDYLPYKIAVYYGNGNWSGLDRHITHWMPLPEPPETDNDKNI